MDKNESAEITKHIEAMLAHAHDILQGISISEHREIHSRTAEVMQTFIADALVDLLVPIYRTFPDLAPVADAEEEDDPALTSEQQVLAQKVLESELARIDEALLFNVSNQWRKLARVVGTTMMELENRTLGLPDVFYSNRLRILVENGVLESQGNLKRMRFSEVRRPMTGNL